MVTRAEVAACPGPVPDQAPIAGGTGTTTKDMTRFGLTLYCSDCTLATVLGVDLKRHAKRCEACVRIRTHARHHCPDMMPDMIRSPNRFTLLASGFALFATLAAHAQTPVTGSAEKGKQLTYTCQGCHGVTGYKNAYPNYRVPKITGQTSEYLVNSLTAYKQGTRKHPTMQAQGQSFCEQDIADTAAYLSSLKK